MRFICFLFLVAFAGAVGYFAYLNSYEVELRFLDWRGSYSLAALVGVAYALGMLSGWSVIGMLRRSLSRVTEANQR